MEAIKRYWWVPLILIVVFGASKKLLAAFSPGGLFAEANADHAKKMVDNIENLKPDQAKMTKQMLAITTIADGLYNAMQDLGTNEGFIFDSLVGLNTEDLKALYKAFGIRENKLFWVVTVQSGNLFDWFQSELSPSDYEKIKVIFSKTGLL